MGAKNPSIHPFHFPTTTPFVGSVMYSQFIGSVQESRRRFPHSLIVTALSLCRIMQFLSAAFETLGDKHLRKKKERERKAAFASAFAAVDIYSSSVCHDIVVVVNVDREENVSPSSSPSSFGKFRLKDIREWMEEGCRQAKILRTDI